MIIFLLPSICIKAENFEAQILQFMCTSCIGCGYGPDMCPIQDCNIWSFLKIKKRPVMARIWGDTGGYGWDLQGYS